MLGNFLEFSIDARPVALESQFYRSLGFQELLTGDILQTPYAAMWDGEAAVGLHEADFASPAITFVRPDLKMYLRALRRLHIEVDSVQLADDEFNKATFLDPSGLAIVLLEARTYSSATRDRSSVSSCGDFLEFSVPTHAVSESVSFWTALGLVVIAEGDYPHDWVRLAGHGLVIGFHQTRLSPGLSFYSPDFDARKEYLSALGLEMRLNGPIALKHRRSASFLSPSGTPFYLLEPRI